MQFTFYGKTYSKVCWLFDPGHGVDTPGKRSPIWPDGTQLLEYDFNRVIAKLLDTKAKFTQGLREDEGTVCTHILVTEEKDIGLSERARRANRMMQDDPDTFFIYLSIHGDAFTSATAHGTTIFTSPGVTASDDIAELFMAGMFKSVKDRNEDTKKKIRNPRVVLAKAEASEYDIWKPHTWHSRGAKEAKFTVLMKTLMPALLLEIGFYTNYIECKYMMSEKGQSQIVQTIFDAMLTVQRKYILK